MKQSAANPGAREIAEFLRTLADEITQHEGSKPTDLDLDDAGWMLAAAELIDPPHKRNRGVLSVRIHNDHEVIVAVDELAAFVPLFSVNVGPPGVAPPRRHQ